MGARIVVAGLTKRYGAHAAVDDVSFEVAAGEVFGLLGPNGAGKTTLLECLAGLRAPDGGTILVDGADVSAEPTLARGRLGVVLQSTALQDRITPREALRLFGAFYPAPVAPEELLARFSLATMADRAYETLSAGQRQRLALALAFVHRPTALLLDEPTAGLDAASRLELHLEIRRLRQEGCTILLATHLLDEAHALCDRLAILRDGRIAAAGRAEELIARTPLLPKITLRATEPLPVDDLRALAGLSEVTAHGERAAFRAAHVGPAVAAVVGLLERQGNTLLDLHVTHPSLEDAFEEIARTTVAP